MPDRHIFNLALTFRVVLLEDILTPWNAAMQQHLVPGDHLEALQDLMKNNPADSQKAVPLSLLGSLRLCKQTSFLQNSLMAALRHEYLNGRLLVFSGAPPEAEEPTDIERAIRCAALSKPGWHGKRRPVAYRLGYAVGDILKIATRLPCALPQGAVPEKLRDSWLTFLVETLGNAANYYDEVTAGTVPAYYVQTQGSLAQPAVSYEVCPAELAVQPFSAEDRSLRLFIQGHADTMNLLKNMRVDWKEPAPFPDFSLADIAAWMEPALSAPPPKPTKPHLRLIK